MNSLISDSFCTDFSTEEACVQALFDARWPSGYRCLACGCSAYYSVSTRRLPLYQCASSSCRHQTSIIAGTIMEGSRIPLTRWFQALYWLSQPSGISSMALSNLLKVTYKTAWLITHKIRHAMKLEDSEQLLSGTVRVERFYYGSPMYPDGQQPLLLGAAQEEGGDPIQIKLHQPSPDHIHLSSLRIKETGVEAFLNEHTLSDTAIVQERYARSIPSFARIKWHVTSWLNSTFRGIGPKHLQAYLHEFCFRWNKQGLSLRATFARTLYRCASSPVLIYKELTRDRPILPRPWHAFSSKSAWKGWHFSRWDDC